MEQKYYVVQRKFRQWDPWETLECRYDTVKAAKAALDRMKANNLPFFDWRVAEAYTQVRYKAVKL